MFEPEEQQLEICLLKSNLEEIEHDFNIQRDAVPQINEEIGKKNREKAKALKVSKTLNKELERLKIENAQYTSKHAQLKKQCVELTDAVETSCEERVVLIKSLNQKEDEIETLICKYEESLQEKAERFRKSFRYYNEEDVNKETEEENKVIAELRDRVNKKQADVHARMVELEAIHPADPESLLEQVGKLDLEKKVKSLIDMHKGLEEKLKTFKK